MMIEDEELRNIFKVASEEHLQKLDSGLLYLEKHPDDQATLEELLREAHSLKGDANMLGVKDVGTLAHQLEHILTQIKRQEESLSSELCDRFAHAIAAIHQLVREAVSGEPAGIDPFRVLAELMGASVTPPEPQTIEPGLANLTPTEAEQQNAIEVVQPPVDNLPPLLLVDDSIATEFCQDAKIAPQAVDAPAEDPPQLSEPQVSSIESFQEYNGCQFQFTQNFLLSDSEKITVKSQSTETDSYRIETIRVATRNLDNLMTQAGELTVTKIRIAHRLAEVESISNLWEEWGRDFFDNRFLLAEQQKNSAANHSAVNQLENFYNRTEKRLEQLGLLIKTIQTALYEDTTRLELISDELEGSIRTLRLLPLSTIFNLFPRMVRDLARQEGKLVELIIEGGETRADKRILEEMKDPLMHILRNAIDHGIESPTERARKGKPEVAKIRLRGYQTPTSIVLEVTDDGRGLHLHQIKQTALKRGICRDEELASMTTSQIQSLIFAPGFSTAPLVTEVSGRGVGLDVVRTNVEKLKGSVHVESTAGQGCTIRIQLGLTLATAHVLIVVINGISYAIPVEFVRTACLVSPDEIFTLEGRDTIIRENCPISVSRLSDLLELSTDGVPQHAVPKNLSMRGRSQQLACIILQTGQEQLGVFVDALVDEQDVVIKPQSQLLKRVRNVSGATILGTGEVCIVLNPQDLIKSVGRRAVSIVPNVAPQATPGKHTVLLVEDSIATRTQEKRILEAAGYEVVTAVDGLDGFTKLQSRPFDAIVSDVQMPNLDGLGLAAKVRQYREYNEIPIILVTSLASDEDKRRGAEAGANAYITKGNFNQDVLLETLQRLI